MVATSLAGNSNHDAEVKRTASFVASTPEPTDAAPGRMRSISDTA
jgi:hypothetical protein